MLKYGVFIFFIFFFNRHSYAEIDWLAFGSLHGHIESCGCDPDSDLGGLKRIATLISREKISYPDLLVFDLGNNLKDLKSIKSKYLSLGLAQLPVDAALLNETELQTFQKNSSRPFVLGNISIHSTLKNKKLTSITKKNAVITGYQWSVQTKKHLVRWNKKLELFYTSLKKKNKPFILLFSGNSNDLNQIVKSEIFDLIISDNNNSSEIVDLKEFHEPNHLVRIKDPLIRMVPQNGMGILRGGNLLNKTAPSVEDLMNNSSNLASFISTAAENIFDQFQDNSVTWLDKKYESNTELQKIFESYNSALSEEYKKNISIKKSSLNSSAYIGSQACKSCHPEAFQKWSNSKHSHAYSTLEKANKQNDGECVSCHVLGFNDRGGFVSKEITPQFLNVQCENCHGPRKKHAKKPSTKLVNNQPTKVCQSCHKLPHSSSFKFANYWQKIKHK